MTRYLMKCGHPNDYAIEMADGSIKPLCKFCGCMDIEKEITNPIEGLKGRTAVCSQHKGFDNTPVESRWDLPFFEYSPDCEYDRYYCGCWGWD